MKKYIFGAVLSLAIILSPAVARQAEAAGLTSSQISAIVALLQAFGADQSVIDSVSTALNGSTPAVTTDSTPYCSISFNPTMVYSSGQYATATWSSRNDADGQLPFSCTGSIGSGQVGANGSAYGAVTQTQTCSLTAVNSQGASYTCSATVNVASTATAVNGTCGSANNQTYSDAPSSNLCGTGTSSSITILTGLNSPQN